MSVVAMDSFGYYDGTVSGMCAAVEAGHGMDGAGALHFTVVGGLATYALPANVASTRSIVGGWLKMGSGGVWSARGIALMTYMSGGVGIISLVSGTDGLVELWRYFDGAGGTPTLLATSSGPMTDPDAYFFVEAQIDFHTSAGGANITIGAAFDQFIFIFSGDMGMDTGPAFIEFSPYTSDGATLCDISWDDVYVLDNVGGGGWHNVFPLNEGFGVFVACLRPNGPSVYAHEPPGTNWDLVNDVIPDEDVTCLSVGNIGAYGVQFAMSDIPWTNGAVAAIKSVVRLRQGLWAGTGHPYRLATWIWTRDMTGVFLYGPNFDEGPGTTYFYHSAIHETYFVGPTETTFSTIAVNYAETGYDIGWDQGEINTRAAWDAHRSTQFALEVLYAPVFITTPGRRYPPQIVG